MSSKKIFEDGSIVEWIDRETTKYTNGEYSVYVWVYFESGFFWGNRAIRAETIKNWDVRPEGSPAGIDEETKQDIINKIRRYYKSFFSKIRVDTTPV